LNPAGEGQTGADRHHPSTPAREAPSRSPAIDRALRVMELLSEAPAGMRMIDISRRLGLPKSSTFLVIEALRARGYLERDAGGAYRLGLRLFLVAHRMLSQLDVRQVARPHLEALSQRSGLTSHLGALDADEVVYLDRVDGRGFVRFDTYVGKRATVGLTAVGRAIAAFLPEARLDGILRATFRAGTERAPTLPFQLKEKLRSFREQGYAVEDEEDVPGVYCVAAAIHDARGDVVASVGVIGLKSELKDGFDALGREVRSSADDISAQLGHRR
jgi:DNA-binding IclR family transcriptional regulator